MKRRGFTWIELVVVLAAVLILSAILFPVFARSSEEDDRAPCQRNLRKVALAIQIYLSDYDERFPIVKVETNPYGWADATQPYVRNTELYQCPSEPTHPADETVRGTNPDYTDYFYNSLLENQDESKLTFITNTILLGDATPGNARQHSTGGNDKEPSIARLVNRNGVPVGAATRHHDGANYAFADGHIKWLKGSDSNTCPAIQNAASGVNGSTLSFAIK